MKVIFQLFLKLHIFMYRASKGKLGGFVSGLPVLLLNSIGAKSGQARTTPLGFFKQPEGFVIVASNAGFDTHPAWYHNLKATPDVTVQVGPDVIKVHAEVLKDDVHTSVWQQIVATAPAYKGYEQKTSRKIPLVLLRTLAQ